jgi:hypothetical protein
MLGSKIGGNTLHVVSHIRVIVHSLRELIFHVSFHRADCNFERIMKKIYFYFGLFVLQVQKMELESLDPFLRRDTNFGSN